MKIATGPGREAAESTVINGTANRTPGKLLNAVARPYCHLVGVKGADPPAPESARGVALSLLSPSASGKANLTVRFCVRDIVQCRSSARNAENHQT